MGEFEAFADSLRVTVPDQFVAAEWGFGSGTVYVHPQAESEVVALASRSGGLIKTATSLSPSERDQSDLVGKVAKAVQASGAPTHEVWFEREGNRVAVSIPADRLQKARAKLSVGILESLSEVGVGLSLIASETGAETAVAKGGMVYSSCTGAFIVKSGSTRGVSTAAHCTSKPSSYDGNGLGTSSALSDRDVRWTRFSSGSSSNNVFQYTSGGYRTATSSGNPSIGSVVCKYGKVTGYFCTSVLRAGESYNGYSSIYKTSAGSVQGGDSGGPWYYGNKAFGVTSGRVFSPSNPSVTTNDLFSGIGSLNLLGVTVVTS